MAPLHWTPTREDVEKSAINSFRQFVNKRYGLDFPETDFYWDLHAWSVRDATTINQFWEALWDWSGMIGDKGPSPLFDASLPMYETDKMARNARLNWAENMLLSHEHARSKSQLAVISCIEPDVKNGEKDGFIRSLTFDQLYLEVAQLASALKELGVGPGDRVAALIPNNAEAITTLLATSSIGAVWSSSPPEFGSTAVLDRLTQLKPKVLLSADKYRAGGKDFSIIPKLAEIVPELEAAGLEHVIIVGHLAKDRKPQEPLPTYKKAKTVAYTDLLDQAATNSDFWRGPANAPLWVLYSSGTTGKPKAIVHNQLGMAWEMKKQGLLHNNLRAGDCQLQITTTGWMMWNQMVNHLCMGMCVVAYDGSPLYPTKTALFDIIDAHNVTSFSLSPRYLQILLQEGYRPKETHSLKHLNMIFSAGSPLKAEIYEFIRNDIKDVFISNGTGGTDICSVFLGSCPVLPMYQGVIQCPFLGVALACFDENGNPYTQGEEGDLVITQPFPNAPLGLLGDDENKTKLKNTYYNQYPGRTVWYQADYLQIDKYTRGITMLGRSDGVLNPQGVRFGSAELYAVVEEIKDEVDDCIAVGQKMPDGDERVILFVRPVAGKPLDEALVKRIKTAIRARLSHRHVPAKVIECHDIPYTVNSKRVEVAVKKIINGAAPSSLNTSGMANPESLQFFVNHSELQLPSTTLSTKDQLPASSLSSPAEAVIASHTSR